MGQILKRSPEQRATYEEGGDNGLVLGEKYLPEELIAEILRRVDCDSLLNGQLVCKRWKALASAYVWRKKAEMTLGRPLGTTGDIPWQVFYAICVKKPFDRNLLKNHSGRDGVEKHWKIRSQGGDHWKVECPPVGAPPLPADEPVFEGQQHCFVTSYYMCGKQQTVVLATEGLTTRLLDKLQPPIIVGEWFGCRWDCPAAYECIVKLIGKNKIVLDRFDFRTTIENDMQNQWHHISHEFTNYGPGLEEITFYHGGQDNLFWAGHYGSKMAGASIIVKLPNPQNSKIENKVNCQITTPVDDNIDDDDDDDDESHHLPESEISNENNKQMKNISYADEID